MGIGRAWDKRFHCEETTDQSQVRMQRWPSLQPEVQAIANTETHHWFRNRAHNHLVSTLVSGSYTKELVSSSTEFREDDALTAARIVQWLLTSQHEQHPSELQGSAQSVSTSCLCKILLSQETHKARWVWV